MVSNRNADLKHSFQKLSKIAKRKGHSNGWGIAWLNQKGKFKLHKGKEPIWQSDLAQDFIEKTRSKLILVHARKGPNPSIKNSHPFLGKTPDQDWVFAHNGSLEISDSSNHKPEGDTDSELFFCNFLDTVEKLSRSGKPDCEPKLVKVAVEQTLRKTRIITALNCNLASENYLYSLRLYKTQPSYYSLYWLIRANKTSITSEKIGKEVGEKAFIVTSEKLSREPWKAILKPCFVAVRVGYPESICFIRLDFC